MQVLHSFNCAVMLDVYGVCVPNMIRLVKGLEFSVHGPDDWDPDGTAVNAGKKKHTYVFIWKNSNC